MTRLSGSRDDLDSGRSISAAVVRFSAVLCLLAVAGGLRAQEQSATAISREVKEIFDRSAPAVVKIRAVDQHGKISGTGFFVDPAGTLYTAFSVGADADNFTVELDGKEIPARQVMTDLRSGLAILKVDVPTPGSADRKIGEPGSGDAGVDGRLSARSSEVAQLWDDRGLRSQVSRPLFFDHAPAGKSTDAAR